MPWRRSPPMTSPPWPASGRDSTSTCGTASTCSRTKRPAIARSWSGLRTVRNCWWRCESQGVLPTVRGTGLHQVGFPEMTAELAAAVYTYLAQAPSKLLLMQMEDGFGVREQPNLPGAADLAAYPNWRLKLPLNLEEWRQSPYLQGILQALRRERPPVRPPGGGSGSRPARGQAVDSTRDLPAATEPRLQPEARGAADSLPGRAWHQPLLSLALFSRPAPAAVMATTSPTTAASIRRSRARRFRRRSHAR